MKKCFSKVAAVSNDLRDYLIRDIGMPVHKVTPYFITDRIWAAPGRKEKKITPS